MKPPIKAGDRIKRTFVLDGETVTEVGVVVHVWVDPETELEDAYIAFLGNEFPDGKPANKPVILRYFVSGLERFES
jgi:hypothetical protein